MARTRQGKPCWDEVEANYDPAKEQMRHADYRIDTQLCLMATHSAKQLL
jgi:hypothetical protein